MLCHHLVSIVGLSWCLYLDESGIEMVTVIFGGELTNPLLQHRWFLRETGRKGSLLYEANDLIFMVAFAILRVFIGTRLLYVHLTNPKPCLSVKLGATCIYAISQMFMVKIALYALKKYQVKLRVLVRWTNKNERKRIESCDT